MIDDLTFELIESTIVEREKRDFEESFELYRWTHVGLLDGIKEERDRVLLAMFYQETLDMMLLESIEDQFETAIFPILRRLFVTNKLTTVYENSFSSYRIRKKARLVAYALNKVIHNYLHCKETKDRMELYKQDTSLDVVLEIESEFCDSFQFSDLKGGMNRARKFFKSKYKHSSKTITN